MLDQARLNGAGLSLYLLGGGTGDRLGRLFDLERLWRVLGDLQYTYLVLFEASLRLGDRDS